MKEQLNLTLTCELCIEILYLLHVIDSLRHKLHKIVMASPKSFHRGSPVKDGGIDTMNVVWQLLWFFVSRTVAPPKFSMEPERLDDVPFQLGDF